MPHCCLNPLFLPCRRSSPGGGWFSGWLREAYLQLGAVCAHCAYAVQKRSQSCRIVVFSVVWTNAGATLYVCVCACVCRMHCMPCPPGNVLGSVNGSTFCGDRRRMHGSYIHTVATTQRGCACVCVCVCACVRACVCVCVCVCVSSAPSGFEVSALNSLRELAHKCNGAPCFQHPLLEY